MARLVTVEVTGQAGQYEAMVKGIAEQNRRLYAESQAGAVKTAQSVASANISMRNLGSATSMVVGQISGLGPVAGLASNAILAMATSAGAVGIAFGGLTAAVGLFG